MRTEQMIALLCLPYILPDYPIHRTPELLAVNYTVPEKRINTRNFDTPVRPADIAGAHKSRRIVPVRKMQGIIRPFQQKGRNRGAKHATFTRTPEMSEIADEIQANLYPVPENDAENPENYNYAPKLGGLSSMTPPRRRIHDVAAVFGDDYLDESEQLDMAGIRLKKPVTSVYTDSYSPVKTRISWEEQEGF